MRQEWESGRVTGTRLATAVLALLAAGAGPARAGEIVLGDPISHSDCPQFCAHAGNYRFSASPSASATADNSVRIVPGYGSGSHQFSKGEVAFRRFGGPSFAGLTGPVDGYFARAAVGANLAGKFEVFLCYDDGAAPCSPSSSAAGTPATGSAPFSRTFELPARGAYQKPRLGLRFLGASGSYAFNGLVVDGRVTWYALDNAVPSVAELTPARGQQDVSPTAEVAASVGDAKLDTATLHVDGALVASIHSAGRISYVPSAPGLLPGVHTASVTASDVAGNPPTTATWQFTVGPGDPANPMQPTPPPTGGEGGGQGEAARDRCVRFRVVVAAITTSFPNPDTRTRCWEWWRLSKFRSRVCNYARAPDKKCCLKGPAYRTWAYDEVSFGHTRTEDRQAIRRCAVYRRGVVYFAPDDAGRWPIPGHLPTVSRDADRRLLLELYRNSIEIESAAAHRTWRERLQRKGYGAMINVGSPLPNAEVKGKLLKLCRQTAGSGSAAQLGVYAGSKQLPNLTLRRQRAILAALDECTTRR